jgi:hypothetical protein
MTFYSYLQPIIQTIVLIGLIKDYLERKYNIDFTNVFFTMSYNTVYIYSKCQILFMKFKKNMNKFIESKPILSKIVNNCNLFFIQNPENTNETNIQLIKNGEILDSDDILDNILNDFSNDVDVDINVMYDFIVYSDSTNKKLIYKGENIITECELSNINFILVELNVDKTSFKINLKNEKYNFYVKGNKLSKIFFPYFFKNIVCDPNFDYESYNESTVSLNIIDQDVNTVNIMFTENNEYIEFDKDGYTVKKAKSDFEQDG